MNDSIAKLLQVPAWLKEQKASDLKEEVLQLGELTGWRRFENQEYGPANFERALILHRLVEILRPGTALEIGTGRGLGCLSMARAAEEFDADLKITTIDIIDRDVSQSWAIRTDGVDDVIDASRDEVWKTRIPKSWTDRVEQIAGSTMKLLPQLVREGRRFDFIFIDGGHNAFNVMFDLSYSMRLLEGGGVILMDDFAPLEEFGVGTCMALRHARNWFRIVKVFRTSGLVYGGTNEQGDFARGMVLLTDLENQPPAHGNALRRSWWRLISRAIILSTSNKLFPM